MKDTEGLKKQLETYEEGKKTAISFMEHHKEKYEHWKNNVEEYTIKINNMKKQLKELDNGQSRIILETD